MRICWTFLIVFSCGATLMAQNARNDCISAVQQPIVNALRMFNTAEMTFHAQHHHFGYVGELLSDESAKKYVPMVGDGNDRLADVTKHFVVTSDGEAYSITATKANGSCAGFGAHTDESGQISLVEPLR